MQKERKETPLWSEGRVFCGRSVVITADGSRQRERSLVERGESVVCPQRRHIEADRSKQSEWFSVKQGESVVCPQRRANRNKQSERSSVEQGERAISASVCITSGPKMIVADQGKLYCRIKSASEKWRELDRTSESRNVRAYGRRLYGILLRMGHSYALDNDLATCMVRTGGIRGEACLFSVMHALQTAHTHAHTHTLVPREGCQG